MLVFEKGYFKKLLKIPGNFDLGESTLQVSGHKQGVFTGFLLSLFFIRN